MSEKVVLLEKRGSVGIITLNRPEKHNALSLELLHAAGDALVELGRDEAIRAVILTGSDRSFSTGMDLNEALQAKTPQDAISYAGEFRTLGYLIQKSRLPVIAAISGWCITGGMELAMMCDIRLASPTAVFGITSAKIGSVAGGGGTQRLPRIVGSARAKEMLFACEQIDALFAAEIGLVNRVVKDQTVLEAALELANKIAKQAPLSIQWLKSAVDVGMNTDLESALLYEAQLAMSAFMTDDRREGMSAFLEKRAPVFRGR